MTDAARPDWGSCRVVDSELVTDRARRITLERPAPLGRPAAPGSHVDVRVRIDGRDDVRSYSIVESDGTGQRLTLTVLLHPASRGGSAYMHGLRVGDTILATRPLQAFPLVPGADRHVLLAGGIGVTALVGMARTLCRLGRDYRFVYVGRSRPAMAYAQQLTQEHGEQMALHVDDEGSPLDVDALIAGIAAEPGRTELLMCGPVRLMDAVRRAWSAAGLAPTDLRFETFGTSGWFDAEAFEVSLPGLGVSTTVTAGQSMLDALTAAGVEIMWDCRKGECGLCVMAVTELSGRLDHRDVFLSDRQKAAGELACVCVTRVVGEVAGAGRVTLRSP